MEDLLYKWLNSRRISQIEERLDIVIEKFIFFYQSYCTCIPHYEYFSKYEYIPYGNHYVNNIDDRDTLLAFRVAAQLSDKCYEDRRRAKIPGGHQTLNEMWKIMNSGFPISEVKFEELKVLYFSCCDVAFNWGFNDIMKSIFEESLHTVLICPSEKEVELKGLIKEFLICLEEYFEILPAMYIYGADGLASLHVHSLFGSFTPMVQLGWWNLSVVPFRIKLKIKELYPMVGKLLIYYNPLFKVY